MVRPPKGYVVQSVERAAYGPLLYQRSHRSVKDIRPNAASRRELTPSTDQNVSKSPNSAVEGNGSASRVPPSNGVDPHASGDKWTQDARVGLVSVIMSIGYHATDFNRLAKKVGVRPANAILSSGASQRNR